MVDVAGTTAAEGSAERTARAAPGLPGRVTIHHGDNLEVVRAFPDGVFTLVYLDPPFNTGRSRTRSARCCRRSAIRS